MDLADDLGGVTDQVEMLMHDFALVGRLCLRIPPPTEFMDEQTMSDP